MRNPLPPGERRIRQVPGANTVYARRSPAATDALLRPEHHAVKDKQAPGEGGLILSFIICKMREEIRATEVKLPGYSVRTG